MIPLTVGDIRNLIENLSDDIVVSQERIEDVYFSKHNWETDKIIDKSISDTFDEYIDCSIAWYDKDNNKLRITPHY